MRHFHIARVSLKKMLRVKTPRMKAVDSRAALLATSVVSRFARTITTPVARPRSKSGCNLLAYKNFLQIWSDAYATWAEGFFGEKRRARRLPLTPGPLFSFAQHSAGHPCYPKTLPKQGVVNIEKHRPCQLVGKPLVERF